MRTFHFLLTISCIFISDLPAAAEQYQTLIVGQEKRLLGFLRTFETFQEELHMAKVPQQRKALSSKVGTLLPELQAELSDVPVPSEFAVFDSDWRKVLKHFENAYMSILASPQQQFLGAFMQSRREFTQGRYLLYAQRSQLPTLQRYWVLPQVVANLVALETPAAELTVQTGVLHRPQTQAHAAYSLYVPENYDPSRSWPVVIALHGSHGRGDEYLLTWLRAAKSHGYVVLAPKSLGRTWSVPQPGQDMRSIGTMLKTVSDEYTIDQERIFVSGLSDGGTFAYALGLHCPQVFAGIAPIAGVLPRWYVLELEQAKTLPFHIIHGAEDFIFPVASARTTYASLQEHEFTNLTYTELPDWGHAYTYSINESLVMPWFAKLRRAWPVAPETAVCAAFAP